jgi:DNA-binding response OmpR family regulator
MTDQVSGGAIVIVEDPFVSEFLRKILQRKGYQVLPVKAGEGLDLLRAGDCTVRLLITNRPAAFTEFAERVPLLYLAAFPDIDVSAKFPASRVLSKPFHPEQLLTCVEQLLQPM